LNISFVTVADLPEGGGNTSRLRTLTQALVRCGHNVTIWNEHALGIAAEGELQAAGGLDGVPFRYALGATARSSGFRTIREKIRAVRVIDGWVEQARRENRLDVLWFNNLSFYDTGWLTWKARRLGIATVQSYEDERQELVSRDSISLSRRLFAINAMLGDKFCPSMADALVVISQYLKTKYEPLSGDPKRVHLIPTIIDCQAWSCSEERVTDCPVILYAGAFGEQDEMEGLVDSLGLLKERGARFGAVLLGDNHREPERVARIRRQVEQLGLKDHVDMPGFVKRVEVRERVERANILINIRREGLWAESGLSTKLSEYLASGRVVVAASVGDVGHYLKDGESAILLKPGVQPSKIADALAKAMSSPETRRRIGRGGLEVAKRHFDLPVAARKLDALLKKIVPSHTAARVVEVP
jgi:glycosyltransferase involved in cell wall biosynthesis